MTGDAVKRDKRSSTSVELGVVFRLSWKVPAERKEKDKNNGNGFIENMRGEFG